MYSLGRRVRFYEDVEVVVGFFGGCGGAAVWRGGFICGLVDF